MESIKSESPNCNSTDNRTDIISVPKLSDDISKDVLSLASSISPSSDSKKSQKSSKLKAPADNVRPVGRLLNELGLDLVRQEVYKDLIDIQAAKDGEHRLADKEKGQLIKLTEAHARLRAKNGAYLLPRLRCAQCRYSTTAANILQLHREHGHCSHSGLHICCVCEAFRTRYPSQFIAHMDTVHRMNGRLAKKPSAAACSFCPYEHKNVGKVEIHALKCGKKFQLSSNLQPLPSDCDIPIKYKPTGWLGAGGMSGRQYDVGGSMGGAHMGGSMPGDAGRYTQSAGGGAASSAMSQQSVMEIGGQLYSWGNHRGKPLLTSLRSQIGSSGVAGAPANGPGYNVASGSPASRPAVATPAPPAVKVESSKSTGGQRHETCEICGMIVESRQALWTHLQAAHKVGR